MSDDYLWNKEGEPDESVVRLEGLLSQFRHDGAPPKLESPVPDNRTPILPFAVLATAASLLTLFALFGGGEARYEVRGFEAVAALSVGDFLETSSGESAEVVIADLGQVTLNENSVLGVRGIESESHRLTLEAGSLHAKIYAPARVFQVATPAGEAIDLGCEYSLDVDNEGNSVLRVLEGRVEFEYDGRAVYVPAGARCTSVVGRGPNAPRFEDAPPKFLKLLEVYEFALDDDIDTARDICSLVTRREDCLTLFHLLDGSSKSLKEAAFERLEQMVPMPEGVTPEGILQGNAEMLLAWRDVMEPAWRSGPGYHD